MTKAETARDLIAAHGTTFAEELGIKLEKNTPSPLFRWLTACILLSAPIQHANAMTAARALADAGYTTVKAMRDATWEARVEVLNKNGYARFDEKTSRMLQDAADLLMDRYRGDLRRLREAAGADPAAERTALKAVKGVGDGAVDIFFREAQAVWPELYPFADKMALEGAKKHKLGTDAKALAGLVPQAEYPRLVAALVREALER
ncbi:hypothetical protein L1787_00835 [Acuticoccus sp. M5D2P5]|uniref:hypothetical protein n=1 Tax=Acuticoccus kalidii TaxID=2910977 RepID=UPI001F316C31|nr:hypothetical protein [Acuticoccus kalidii]MCF3931956.1 hypothetical protein [Acuticoccus kalidii]